MEYQYKHTGTLIPHYESQEVTLKLWQDIIKRLDSGWDFVLCASTPQATMVILRELQEKQVEGLAKEESEK